MLAVYLADGVRAKEERSESSGRRL